MTTVKKVTHSILKSLNEAAEPVAVKESYSEEIARELFVSLIKLGYGAYSVLNDGYFVEKIYADSDEEAIKKFYELNKRRDDGPRVYAEDQIDTAKDGDIIQYTEGVGIKLEGIGVVLVEGTLKAQKPIKSQVEALNVAEYKRSLKLAKTVSESIALKRVVETISLDEVADQLNAAGISAKNINNRGLNLATDGTQYGVQLVGEKDGQVKVAVVAKRGGKLLDLTSKATTEDVVKTIKSLLNKTGEPAHKGKSVFMKADEATELKPVSLIVYITIDEGTNDEVIFQRDYRTREEAVDGLNKWAEANLDDFDIQMEEYSNDRSFIIEADQTYYATIKGKEANEAIDPKQLKTIKDIIRDYLYYGESLDTFIAQDYPIARGMSREELRVIWRECMSEAEEL